MAEVDQNLGDHSVDEMENNLSVDHRLESTNDDGLDHVLDDGAEDPDLDDVVDDDGADPGDDHGADDHDVDHSDDLPIDQEIDDDAVDPELDHATDDGEVVEHNVDHAIEHDVEEHAIDENVDHAIDENVGHAIAENVDHAIELEQDIEHAADRIPETFQAQEKHGHGEDAVTGGGIEKKWPGWPGESVFRMLVPAQKVGSIIGRKGEFIKKIVEETRARIKILDGPPGTSERAVMVSGKEEPDSSLPPAMDGLLRVHKRVVDGLDGDSSQVPSGNKVSTRLLVPASQAGSLIGKQGGTVKSIQEASSCVVRVLGSEDLPVFALQDDRVVEVLGDPAGVHKAVELIGSHLRKFLVDRSIIPVFEMQMQNSNPPMEHMPPHQSWGPPQGLPPNASGGPNFGAPNPQYMPPPRQMENYYPPADLPPPMEKQPHQGISAYGREAPMNVHASSNSQAAHSMITQLSQQMQIPLLYADAVIGASGASISYIRRASGATVTIQETRGVPGEMTVEISGTASQVQTAQQLIQNFMAEAAAAAAAPAPAPTQAQTGGSTTEQGGGYNPYAAAQHGSVYASPPSNPGHAGSYGSVYGTNYGY